MMVVVCLRCLNCCWDFPSIINGDPLLDSNSSSNYYNTQFLLGPCTLCVTKWQYLGNEKRSAGVKTTGNKFQKKIWGKISKTNFLNNFLNKFWKTNSEITQWRWCPSHRHIVFFPFCLFVFCYTVGGKQCIDGGGGIRLIVTENPRLSTSFPLPGGDITIFDPISTSIW